MTQTTEAEPAEEKRRPRITLGEIVLDTDDPPRLAEFYAALLGWPITRQEEDWWTVGTEAGPQMSFQLALDHRPPSWPDNDVPQQFHLDLDVDELPSAVAYAESLGARPADNTRSTETFVVLLDPSGHPFCLCSG
jgi:predicted enzyme related to lactoylglutathione lyase